MSTQIQNELYLDQSCFKNVPNEIFKKIFLYVDTDIVNNFLKKPMTCYLDFDYTEEQVKELFLFPLARDLADKCLVNKRWLSVVQHVRQSLAKILYGKKVYLSWQRYSLRESELQNALTKEYHELHFKTFSVFVNRSDRPARDDFALLDPFCRINDENFFQFTGKKLDKNYALFYRSEREKLHQLQEEDLAGCDEEGAQEILNGINLLYSFDDGTFIFELILQLNPDCYNTLEEKYYKMISEKLALSQNKDSYKICCPQKPKALIKKVIVLNTEILKKCKKLNIIIDCLIVYHM